MVKRGVREAFFSPLFRVAIGRGRVAGPRVAPRGARRPGACVGLSCVLSRGRFVVVSCRARVRSSCACGVRPARDGYTRARGICRAVRANSRPREG